MNEDFLNSFRRDPDPQFARALRDRLRRQDSSRQSTVTIPWHRRWAPALMGAGALATIAILLTVPSVRAAAQSFLELFRARHFVAISFDPARLEKLRNGNVDLRDLIADQVETIKEPGEPVSVATIEEAGRVAGMVPRMPTYIPTKLASQPELFVRGEGRARLVGSSEKLQAVLDTLAIDDVKAPQSLDGAVIDVRMPAAIVARYGEKGSVTLLQSHVPEVALPAGTDLRQLGEIALRITGMSADEASRFADGVDWNSTLLVPVPATASSFRDVDVQGSKGLLVTFGGRETEDGEHRERHSIIFWSDGETVFALKGSIANDELLEMANSMR